MVDCCWKEDAKFKTRLGAEINQECMYSCNMFHIWQSLTTPSNFIKYSVSRQELGITSVVSMQSGDLSMVLSTTGTFERWPCYARELPSADGWEWHPKSRTLAVRIRYNYYTRWWFQTFFIFTPSLAAMIPFDLHIFLRWVVQPPTRLGCFRFGSCF